MSKGDLEKFINNQYQIYKIKNFNAMIDYCYSFGCKNSEYKNDISKITKSIFNSIISKLIKNKIKYSYKESNDNIKLNITYSIKNYLTSNVKLYIPADVNSYSEITNLLFEYILENKINCNIKLSKLNRNDLLVLSIFDYKDAEVVIKYLGESIVWKKASKIKNICLFPNVNDIGICTDIYPYNYINVFNNLLCLYFKENNNSNILVEDFISYLNKRIKEEKRYLRKYIINTILTNIDIIINNKNPFQMFKFDSNMDIGNKNINNYKLLIDNKKIVYFQDKLNTHNILFNSKDYLSLCYAKYYENIIKKNSELEFYAFFRNIYIRIAQNNFKDIEILLDFSYLNKDDIYNQLAIISFIYFSIEKMNLSYKYGYKILKQILENKYKCKIDYNEKQREENIELPFTKEYQNKIIKLKNGKVTTIYEFFKENEIFKNIPINCILHLKDGTIMKSEKFLNNIHKIINNYNDINEIINDIILLIEFN